MDLDSTPGGGNNGLELIRAPQAWNLVAYGYANDAFADVGVIDGGTDDYHPDLVDRVITPDDTFFDEHGAHVAGIIASTWGNQEGVEGVAPHEPLIHAFAYADTDSDFAFWHHSLQTLFSRVLKDNPDVVAVNMSYGFFDYCADTDFDSFCDVFYVVDPQTELMPGSAWTYAEFSDHFGTMFYESSERFAAETRSNFLIASAVGYDARPEVRVRDDSPMSNAAVRFPDRHFIAVEMVGPDDVYDRTFFGFGTNLGGSVSAPGFEIRSAEISAEVDEAIFGAPVDEDGDGDPDYATFSGTSMATPHVTGLISYLWHLDPNLTFSQVRELITHADYTAETQGGTQPRIDAFAAAMGIDLLNGNQRLQAALVDVNDFSELDGNARRDRDDENENGITDEAFEFVDARELEVIPYFRGDGTVDMRDFRAFRDAVLQVLSTEEDPATQTLDPNTLKPIPGTGMPYLSPEDVMLDGPDLHFKKDLNLDGEVAGTPPEIPAEILFSRFDFNGNGRLDPETRLANPGTAGLAPYKLDPDTDCILHADFGLGAGCLQDIDILAHPGVWLAPEGITSSDLLNDRGHDGVIDYLQSADFHFNIDPDPRSISSDLVIQIESKTGGANGPTLFTETIVLPGPLSTSEPTKLVATIPLFGARPTNAVKITVQRGSDSDSFAFDAVEYGKDQVVRVKNLVPIVDSTDLVQREGTDSSPTTFVFDVTLPKAVSEEVSFTYSTSDGTGTAGVDYLPVTNAPLQYAANQANPITPLQVDVIADSEQEPNRTFNVSFAEEPNVAGPDGLESNGDDSDHIKPASIDH